jgi:hypothetical protein
VESQQWVCTKGGTFNDIKVTTLSYSMTTEATRLQGLDKFYTKPDIVRNCLSSIDWKRWDFVIEPSAGNGSFLVEIPVSHKIGLDIEPENDDIIKCDFFDYHPPNDKGRILVVGNPPFGKVSSTAIKFFNHASQWCDCIAFIIPRTFRRISVQNKLNVNFHLIHDEDIPNKPCSFEPPMSVKCCFQIWERRESQRGIINLPVVHRDWDFLHMGPKDTRGQPTPPDGADFALRAYGGKCGHIETNNLDKLRPKSWHWIKSNIEKDELIQKFKMLDYSVSEDTARQNSIGKAELVSLYSSSFDHNNEP